MGFDFAEALAKGRRAVHNCLAVKAVYEPAGSTDAVPVNVRWANKLQRAGSLDSGFDAEIIEGIDRLIFSAEELETAKAGSPLELESGGVVTLIKAGAKFRLDEMQPSDGEINVYWLVVRIPD
jgi:hypothetical protein